MNFTSKTILLGCALFLYACSGDESEEVEGGEEIEEQVLIIDHSIVIEEIQSVSKTDNALGDDEPVTLTSRINRNKNIIIRLDRSTVLAENTVISTAKDNPAIIIEAVWEEAVYVQSSEHSTHASIEIISLDFENVVGYVKLLGQLVNPETGAMFVIEESTVEIGGLNFYALTNTGPNF